MTDRYTSWAESAATRDCGNFGGVRLTPRQLEVLELLCEGLPNKLISRRLNIAAGTVKVHIASILRELGVSSRLQAVVAAQRCGLVKEAAQQALRAWQSAGPLPLAN